MIFGWDLGGAHVKLAVLEAEGRLHSVAQAPCELWMGLDRIDSAVFQLHGAGARDAVHAVTMTGELADIFPDRAAGVTAIVEAFLRACGIRDAMLFAGAGFVHAAAAGPRWAEIASANWLATASLVAQRLPQALLVDVGSTTTDIVVVADGEVRAEGASDHARLVREELVYTGVVRTPVMALASKVPFAGEWVSLMAEHFATTADIYRITGDLDAAFDQARTADGRGRSQPESMRRLARMIGCDFETTCAVAWEGLAHWLADAQQRRVEQACQRQLSRGLLGLAAPIVGLGVGRFLAARVAADLGRDYVDFSALFDIAPGQRAAVDVCGPAFAVACLARGR